MTLEEWNTFFQFSSAVLLGITFAVGAGAIWTSYLLGKRQEERIAEAGRDIAKLNADTADARSVIERARAEAARADERAAEANSLARKYEADIAGANERASEAESKAAEAALELAKFRAPRLLTREQQDRIVEAIRRFAGQEYTISVAQTPEPLSFVRTIDAMLMEAGWKFQEYQSLIRINSKWGIALSDNVRVQIAPSKEAELSLAITTLVTALRREGIAASAERLATLESRPAVIHIAVGSKPQQ